MNPTAALLPLVGRHGRGRGSAAILLLLLAALPNPRAFAQGTSLAPGQQQSPPQKPMPPMEMPQKHDMTSMTMNGVLGIPMTREGSGTSWLPDATPMHALHRMAGPWTLMFHSSVFLQYIDESGPRGDNQFGSVNWFMPMARRSIGKGSLTFRGMFSLEPITVGKCGYPDVLATGEACNNAPLHDRQHPHDLFMELAGVYERELASNLAVQFYAGLAGEPALGPTAFPHRPSAFAMVMAPITHHWLDSTHISFGVVTAGVFQKRWKAEVSAFNGREPDEKRYGIDLAPLDSYSGRISFLPTANWIIQFSAGTLKDAEDSHSGVGRVDVRRVTTSATYHRQTGERMWATTGAWGRNTEQDVATNAVLLESTLDLDGRNIVFGRFEAAEKTRADLVVAGDPDQKLTVSKLIAGYQRQLRPVASMIPGVGAAFTLNMTPSALAGAYGNSPSPGVVVFLSVRPRQSTSMMGHSMGQPASR